MFTSSCNTVQSTHSLGVGNSLKIHPIPLYLTRLGSLPSLPISTVPTTLEEKETTLSFSVSIQKLFTELKQAGVRIPKWSEVYDYLLRFPNLIDVVRRATKAALKHLSEAQLYLELYHNPEIEDEHLVLYARFPEYEEDVMERIHQAQKEYRYLLRGKSGYLILTTDFRHPE